MIQKTKGKKKMISFLKDLIVNKKFVDEMFEFNSEKSDEKKERKFIEICFHYGLSMEDFFILNETINKDNPKKHLEEILTDNYCLGACDISDNFTLHLDENEGELYKKAASDYLKYRAYFSAYPVSINIRLQASRNDVIDFIEKRWKDIDRILSWHRESKNTNIKTRKNEKLNDYVYDLRDLKLSDAKKLVDKKFNKLTVDKIQIRKIKIDEKNRREEIKWLNLKK